MHSEVSSMIHFGISNVTQCKPAISVESYLKGVTNIYHANLRIKINVARGQSHKPRIKILLVFSGAFHHAITEPPAAD